MKAGLPSWHHGRMEKQTLTAAEEATARWEEAKDALAKAKEERDDAIRAAHEDGWPQTDIVKSTDLTRETIRRITNPDAAAAVRTAQRRSPKGSR